MSRVCELAHILPDRSLSVGDSALSYIECLMPKSRFNKALLLYKERPSEDHRCKLTVIEDLQLTMNELDVTGTPLEYELCYPELDESIVDNRNWRKEEEFYSPLAKSEARTAINCCRQNFCKLNWSAPLFAICDGKDSDKTVLMGSNVDEKWFTTVQIFVSGDRLVSEIEETPVSILNEYTNKYSIQKDKVVTAVSGRYELCGKRPGILDLSDIVPGCFNCSLSIEVNWNTLSFYAPIRNSTSTLIMEIVTGWNDSNFKNLWNELASLDQYLNMLDRCKKDVQTPRTMNPTNPIAWNETEERLNLLLNGEVENKYFKDGGENNSGDVTDQDKLQKLVDGIKSRENMDFADMLWELLKSCADYTHLTSCFRTVLDQIQSGSAAPQFTSKNSTRITTIISKIMNQERAVPLLDQNSPLELLIDTGLEKLCRDYTYVLLTANLIDLEDIRQTLCNVQDGAFNIESYRKKLTSLAQIHLCLEFTLFAENYLNCPIANLRTIFSYAFRKYVTKNSPIESYSDLHENDIQCLKVPLPTVAVEHVAKGLPSSWCLTLSSETSESAITTATYLSRTPIIPPNIYCFDDPKEHQVYHCLNLNISSMKFA